MSSPARSHVREVMSAPVETISPDATVKEATEAMHANDIEALLVPGREMGIVTSTDVLAAIAQEGQSHSASVADVMTSPVESVTVNLGLQEVVTMMTTYGINHLPVRDSDGEYVGMVSSTDIRKEFVTIFE